VTAVLLADEMGVAVDETRKQRQPRQIADGYAVGNVGGRHDGRDAFTLDDHGAVA